MTSYLVYVEIFAHWTTQQKILISRLVKTVLNNVVLPKLSIVDNNIVKPESGVEQYHEQTINNVDSTIFFSPVCVKLEDAIIFCRIGGIFFSEVTKSVGLQS